MEKRRKTYEFFDKDWTVLLSVIFHLHFFSMHILCGGDCSLYALLYWYRM